MFIWTINFSPTFDLCAHQNITVLFHQALVRQVLGILECLKEDSSIRVIAGDINSHGAVCDKFIQMPASDTPISSIKPLKYEEKPYKLCYQSPHGNYLNFQRISRDFKNGCVVVSEFDLSVANDKGKLHRFANDIGIPVPEGRYCDSKDA